MELSTRIEWFNAINYRLIEISPLPIIPFERGYVHLTTTDGHSTHVMTLQDLYDALQALTLRAEELAHNNENGGAVELGQEIIALYALVANATRVI